MAKPPPTKKGGETSWGELARELLAIALLFALLYLALTLVMPDIHVGS